MQHEFSFVRREYVPVCIEMSMLQVFALTLEKEAVACALMLTNNLTAQLESVLTFDID
jgi:hypothetical protein